MPKPHRCAACAKSAFSKPTSVYARWYPTGGESSGYKIQLCEGCVEHFLVPWVKASFSLSADDESCPACGAPRVEHWSYTWVTAFAGKTEPLRFTLIACENCAQLFRASFMDHGTRLDDRPPLVVADGGNLWRQLGIDPATST